MDYDVIVAGGGPVGLLLASELKLNGVSVLVLEKMADPTSPSKEARPEAEGSTSPLSKPFIAAACFRR